MKNITSLVFTFLLAFGLTACVDEEGDTGPTKDEIRDNIADGKGDGFDWCEELDWYGDEICDDFCLLPDPDCSVECDVDPAVVTCAPGMLFDVETCACQDVAICTAEACPAGSSKNPFTCVCEANETCDVDPTVVLCAPGMLFDVESCACQDVAICTAEACPAGFSKNPFTCVCEVNETDPVCDIDPAVVTCAPGMLFDVESCACEDVAICTAEACPPGFSKNPFTCVCEVNETDPVCDVDPAVVTCAPGMLFDVETCACQDVAICTAEACPPGFTKNPFTCVCELF